MKYTKVRDVKDPQVDYNENVGIDFFIPNDWNNGEPFSIGLGEQVNIPSGIKVVVPHGYQLRFDNKSGVALKKGLVCGATIVDPGYRGEVHLNMFKVVRGTVEGEVATLTPGEKIVQGILTPVRTVDIEPISNEEYDSLPATGRGEGGFGSTGVK